MPRNQRQVPDLIVEIVKVGHLPQGKRSLHYLTRKQLVELLAWMHSKEIQLAELTSELNTVIAMREGGRP